MPVFKQILREHLEKNLPGHELARWYDPLDLVLDENEQVIRVAFPHAFFAEWFKATARPVFEKQVRAASTHLPYPIVYQDEPRPCENPDKNGPGAAGQESQPLPLAGSFATFLVNRKNDFPLAAAMDSVEKATCPPYTPFIVYGPSGCGKTHLLEAMVNAVRSKGLSCLYEDMAYPETSIFSRCSAAPINEQCLFLDDAQRLGNLPEHQDAMAAIIDAFTSSGRLLVLSLDAHPSMCQGFRHKVKSRLAAGLVVEIKRPDLDIRRQYVQTKNDAACLELSRQDILSLAQRYEDIRAIDGALTRLQAYRSLMPSSDPAARGQDIAALLARGARHSVVTPQIIILCVARYMSVSPEDITGKSRDRKVTLARHMAIVLCRELLGLSLVQTGKIFGGRDHSSILYSIKKIKELQSGNNDMHKKLEELRKQCLSDH